MTAVKVSHALVLVTGLLTELVHASVETRVALEEAGLISHLWGDDGQELVRLAILVQHVLPRTWWASAAQNELESQECIASLVLKVLNEGAPVLEAIVFAAVHDQFKEAPRHPRDGPWSEDYLRRALAERFHLPPLLLSSETVETWLLPVWYGQYRRWVTAQDVPITAAQRAEAAREQRKQVTRHQRFWKQHDRMEAVQAEQRAKEAARVHKEAALQAQRQRLEEQHYAYVLDLYRREPRLIWEMHHRVRERFFKRMLCT